MSTEPLKILKNTAELTDRLDRVTFGDEIYDSRFLRDPVKFESEVLPSERYVLKEAIMTIDPPGEFTDTKGLERFAKKPNALKPEFRLVMENELENQRKRTNELFAHVSSHLDKQTRTQIVKRSD